MYSESAKTKVEAAATLAAALLLAAAPPAVLAATLRHLASQPDSHAQRQPKQRADLAEQTE